jgi:site-specific DNA recombinase
LWGSRQPERKRLKGLMEAPASAEVHMHPNLAELYRREVEQLHEALIDPSCRDEAFGILRGLIDRISVHPGESGLEIELTGAIVAMVELALGSAESERHKQQSRLSAACFG